MNPRITDISLKIMETVRAFLYDFPIKIPMEIGTIIKALINNTPIKFKKKEITRASVIVISICNSFC